MGVQPPACRCRRMRSEVRHSHAVAPPTAIAAPTRGRRRLAECGESLAAECRRYPRYTLPLKGGLCNAFSVPEPYDAMIQGSSLARTTLGYDVQRLRRKRVADSTDTLARGFLNSMGFNRQRVGVAARDRRCASRTPPAPRTASRRTDTRPALPCGVVSHSRPSVGATREVRGTWDTRGSLPMVPPVLTPRVAPVLEPVRRSRKRPL